MFVAAASSFGQRQVFVRPDTFVDPFKLPAKTDYAKDHVVVAFWQQMNESARSMVRARYGLTLNTEITSRYFEVWDLPRSARAGGLTVESVVRALQTEPALQFAEFDTAITPDMIPNDAGFGTQYGMHNTGQSGGTVDADIDAPEAWDVTAGDPEIVVAVCDDGYDWSHPDLDNAIWMNPDEIAGNGIDDDSNGFIDDVRGWDFASGDNNPAPSGGTHGTHTSGTVGAEFNNGIGAAGFGTNIKVMALRMYTSATWMTALTNAVDYAWQNGAKVISISYNIDGYTNALVQAIQRADTADVIYVNSAGNNSQANPPRQAIRNLANNVIFVAANDRNDQKASFSNWGTLVEIFAPGVDIYSTLPSNSYGLNSGTSMSTPHVAGALGAIRAHNPGLTDRQALDRLILRADSKASLSAYVANGKRLNLGAAIETDTVPPGAVTGLTVRRRAYTAAEMELVTTGDDGSTGQASGYDVRASTSPVTEGNFSSATPLAANVPQAPGGSTVTFPVNGMWPGEMVYIAVRASDNVGNVGPITTFGPFSTKAPFFGDRVEGANQFTPTGTWATTTTTPFNGARCWSDSPAGNYVANANSSLTQTSSTIVPGPVALKFQAKFALEWVRDYVHIEVSVNGGAFQLVRSLSGTQANYRLFTAPVMTNPGDTVQFRFRLTSDATTVADGISIDDISVVPMNSVFFDNIEGVDNFTPASPWAKVTTSSFSPTRSWHDSPAGNYANSVNIALTGNSSINTTSLADPVLLMMANYNLERNFDYLRIECSGDAGATYTETGQLNGVLPTWHSEVLALAPFESIRLRFRLTTDTSTVADGAYLDDIRIVGEPWENVVVMSGQVHMPYFVGNATSRPLTVEVRNPGTSTVVDSQSVPLVPTSNPSISNYMFVTGALGSRDVTFKCQGYLKRKVAGVNVAIGMGLVSASLVYGDADGNNAIDSADENLIRVALFTGPGNAHYNPLADLDGSNFVDKNDYLNMIPNLGQIGD